MPAPDLQPVFVADIATLLTRVRMQQDSAPEGLTEQAMEEVRLWLLSSTRGLGATRVAQLQAIPYVENTTDPTSIQRTCANVLEILMFRRRLLDTMPTLFMDESEAQEAWNEDGFVRSSASRIDAMAQAMDMEIHDKLNELRGEPEKGGRLNATTIQPDCPPLRPFDSIRPGVYFGGGPGPSFGGPYA